jgi:hypothetical protein
MDELGQSDPHYEGGIPMSTDFRMLIRGQLKPAEIRLSEVFDGRLERWGITEHISLFTEPGEAQCLTDGEGAYLWIHADEAGMVTTPTWNKTSCHIVDALFEAFGVDIVSEHQPEYWGYATEAEWTAAWAAIHREIGLEERAFESALLAYVRGEPHEIPPHRMEEAEIAGQIAARNPELLRPERSAELLTLTREEFRCRLDVPF